MIKKIDGTYYYVAKSFDDLVESIYYEKYYDEILKHLSEEDVPQNPDYLYKNIKLCRVEISAEPIWMLNNLITFRFRCTLEMKGTEMPIDFMEQQSIASDIDWSINIKNIIRNKIKLTVLKARDYRSEQMYNLTKSFNKIYQEYSILDQILNE